MLFAYNFYSQSFRLLRKLQKSRIIYLEKQIHWAVQTQNNALVAQWITDRSYDRARGHGPTGGPVESRGLGRSAWDVQQCISHVSRMARAAGGTRRRGGGAAPSVATAGRPRLERRAPQPTAPLCGESGTHVSSPRRPTYDSSPWTSYLDFHLPCSGVSLLCFCVTAKGFSPRERPLIT